MTACDLIMVIMYGHDNNEPNANEARNNRITMKKKIQNGERKPKHK